MPRLRDAWVAAWGELPEAVHQELTTRGKGGPSRRVVRVVFATAFGDEQPAALRLDAELRSPRSVFTERPVDDDAARRIREVLARRATTLDDTSRLFTVLKRAARAAGLPGDQVDEHLLRRAYVWSEERAWPDGDQIEALLVELGVRPTPERLRALLDAEPDLVRELDALLAAASTLEQPAHLDSDAPGTTRRHPYLALLDDADLADGRSTAESEERWAAALDVPADVWHWRTAALGLSATSPPPVPPTRSVADDVEISAREWHPRWLDTSIEERCASSLRREASARARLPALPDLLRQEVERARRPLGLAESDSRTVVALGSFVAERSAVHDSDRTGDAPVEVLGAGELDVRAAVRVRQKFFHWQAEQKQARGVAGFPRVWAGILADPGTFLVAHLWVRLHNEEIYGREAITADRAWRAVVGIASTVIDRLKSLPASQPSGWELGGEQVDSSTPGLAGDQTLRVFFAVDSVRARQDPAEFTAFFERARTDADAPAQWAAWTADAGVVMPLAAVLAWLDEHAETHEDELEEIDL